MIDVNERLLIAVDRVSNNNIHGQIACKPDTTPALKLNQQDTITKKDIEQLCVVVSRALRFLDFIID